MPTTVRSYSKINLGLAIGPVRADGFHALTTLYQTLEAHDLLTLSAKPLPAGGLNRIRLRANHPRVPLDGRNTIWKMLDQTLALPVFRAQSWVIEVELDKRLPIQGGLGAGSANAAAALLALERETGIEVAGGERLRIAAAVGSDVPLFLVGGAVLGLGRGEQVFPMPDLVPGGVPAWVPDGISDLLPAAERIEEQGTGQAKSAGHSVNSNVNVVLALPDSGVSTPQAFRDWDVLIAERDGAGRQGAPSLTPSLSSSRLEELSRALAAAFCEPQTSSGVFPAIARADLVGHPLSALVRTGIRNDFEEVVFRQHPFLGTIKRALLGLDDKSAGETASRLAPASGALYAALSGSGSALFGLYAHALAASEAEGRLKAMSVRTMRTCLLSRSAYWEQMFVPDL